MNRELMEALDILEKEKNISKDTLLEAIEQSLIQACKNHFGKADNVHVTIDPETCDFAVYADRTVVEYVEDPAMEISLDRCTEDHFQSRDRRNGTGSDPVKGIRTYRNTECQERDPAEDP